MAKKSIAGVELTALVNELQFVVGGKVSQIYHQEKKELLFQLHARGKGKQLLKVVPGKFLCLTDRKDVPLAPSSFCMQLRKYLGNASINSFFQKEAERIVVFELEKKEKYFLIVELFSKGNIVLTDDKYMIIGTLERQVWKDRVVKNKEKYVFPEAKVNWKKISVKELDGILKKSDKKNLATCLATEVNLGGVYAEEVLRRSLQDKEVMPASGDASKIMKAVKEMIVLLEKPQGCFYSNDITPFPLTEGEVEKKVETYNEAINTLNPFEIISPYEKRIKTLKGRVKQQEEAIVKLEEDIVVNTKKGERIYEKYADLQKLLDIVKAMRKEKEWKEIGKELKKNSKIISVNLKDKKVVVEL